MGAWDSLVVGGPILADNQFGGGWQLDTTQALDGGVIGTTQGYDGDPFNFNYNTAGQLKLGGYLQCHQYYATSYNFPHVSDQRNKEPQHYVHPHSGNPNPLDLFEIDNGVLVARARKTLPGEDAWARIKGYSITETGREATYDWWAANGGLPADWAPSNPSGTGGGLAFFQNMPAPYIAPMLSTYNRYSMSFGRSMARLEMPVGARARGSTSDLRNVDTWFPAYWDLEDVPAECDINGRQHALDTYTPGNPGAGGVLNELDQLELFGYSNTQIHTTSHHYQDGLEGYLQSITGNDGNTIQFRRGSRIQKNHTPPYASIAALRGVPVEVGVDRFPPSPAWPTGLICYHVNRIVQFLYAMPDYLGQPKIIYDPIPTVPYIPQLNTDWTVKRLGSQQYANGDPAYTHWCSIWNIALSAPFTLSQAVGSINNGTAPSFSESEEMRIHWAIMEPLLSDNPDTKPFINYRQGDFGGSGTGVGPIPTVTTGATINVSGDWRELVGAPPVEPPVDPGDPPSTSVPTSESYRPDLGNGIEFEPGHLDGIVRYRLRTMVPGQWDYSSYGGDATLIGSDTEQTLTLRVDPVSASTPRVVLFEPTTP